MEACLRVFEQGWDCLPKDNFLGQGVILLRAGPKVAQFRALCVVEWERCYGAPAKMPYSVQSGWIHNVRLAKSMVLWVLGGRQSPPQRLSRTKKGRNNRVVVMMTAVPSSAPLTPPSWEDRLLSMAWRMFQHILVSISSSSTPSQSKSQLIWPSLALQSTQWSNKIEDPAARSRAIIEEQEEEPLFYPAQVEMAERLFGTLFGRTDVDLGYEETDFRILLPPSASLQAQTIKRVRQLFGNGRDDLKGKVLNRCMFRAGVANKDYDALKEAVMEKDLVSGRKRRLMVIVVDECHLGIGKGGQMDVLVHGAPHKQSGIECNRERILLEDNVYIVYVSATGWNCMPGVLPEKTVVWSKDPTGYTGWKSYALEGGRNKDRLCKGEGYQHLLEYFQSLFRNHGKGNGKSSSSEMDPAMFTLLPSLVLMVDYGLGFLGCSSSSEETQRIVSSGAMMTGGDSIGSNSTVVVRVQPNGAQGAMVRWLRYFLAGKGRVETSLEGTTISGKGSCICVLVEKGRYGDSFPGRLTHYDLRARYQSTTCTFSSLLQDVGRCFGYKSSSNDDGGPWILLNPQGYRLFLGQEATNKKMVVDRYLNKQGNGPSRNSMWFGKDKAKEEPEGGEEEVEQRWALLLAQPQVGKTGVYLRLLQMVKERLHTI